MDRVGGIAVLLALYYFWSSLFQRQGSFLGYSRAQMLSYVLFALVLAMGYAAIWGFYQALAFYGRTRQTCDAKLMLPSVWGDQT